MENYCSKFTMPELTAPALRQLMRENGEQCTLPAKHVFGLSGEHLGRVYYILDGRTSHYLIAPDGREKLLYTLTAGWFVGDLMPVIDMPCTSMSVTDVETKVWEFDYLVFHKMVDTSPEFRHLVFEDNAKKMMILEKEIASLTFESNKDRLIRFFMVAADRSQLIDGAWYDQQMNYTQNDLSTVIGSSRITVSKVLRELQGEGKIRMLNRRIQVNAFLNSDDL